MTPEWSNAIFHALDFEHVGFVDRDQVLGRWAAVLDVDKAQVGPSSATTTTTATSDDAFTTWSARLSSESPAARELDVMCVCLFVVFVFFFFFSHSLLLRSFKEYMYIFIYEY